MAARVYSTPHALSSLRSVASCRLRFRRYFRHTSIPRVRTFLTNTTRSVSVRSWTNLLPRLSNRLAVVDGRGTQRRALRVRVRASAMSVLERRRRERELAETARRRKVLLGTSVAIPSQRLRKIGPACLRRCERSHGRTQPSYTHRGTNRGRHSRGAKPIP